MFSLKGEKIWIKILLILIVTFTITVSINAVLKYNNYYLLGSIEKMDNDDVKYIRSAWTLIDKGIFTYKNSQIPTVFIMPGHTIILAGFMKLFGRGQEGIEAFRIFQAILQGISIYILFLIGRRCFNSTVAIIACIINALYIPELFSVGLIMTEIEFKLLFLLLIYITIYAIIYKKKKYYMAGGVLWGITCLFRPTAALYPAIVFILWIVYRYSFREVLKYTTVVLVSFGIVMSPWWIRNYITFNRFIPLTLSSGNPFLQGTYINYDQSANYTPYFADNDEIQTNKIEMETGMLRLGKYFKENPLGYIYWYTLGKTWRLWSSPFYWKEIFNISIFSAGIFHYIILGLGVLGFYMSRAYKKSEGIFVILPIIYFTIAHLPFYTLPRYAYPVMPIVILLGAFGIYGFMGKWFLIE
jgi:4-amino-4-deoxy-L-arabinose transferase-like glycosyltransferase